MTKTARTIAARLAVQYLTCIGNFEPSGAMAVDDCVTSLDLVFPGVEVEFRHLVDEALKNA